MTDGISESEDIIWLKNQVAFARRHLVEALDHYKIPLSERHKFEPQKKLLAMMDTLESQASVFINEISYIIYDLQAKINGENYSRNIFGDLEWQCPTRRRLSGRDSLAAWDNLDYDAFAQAVKVSRNRYATSSSNARAEAA